MPGEQWLLAPEPNLWGDSSPRRMQAPSTRHSSRLENTRGAEVGGEMSRGDFSGMKVLAKLEKSARLGSPRLGLSAFPIKVVVALICHSAVSVAGPLFCWFVISSQCMCATREICRLVQEASKSISVMPGRDHLKAEGNKKRDRMSLRMIREDTHLLDVVG